MTGRVKTEKIVREWFNSYDEANARRNQLNDDGTKASLVAPPVKTGPQYYVEYLEQ